MTLIKSSGTHVQDKKIEQRPVGEKERFSRMQERDEKVMGPAYHQNKPRDATVTNSESRQIEVFPKAF